MVLTMPSTTVAGIMYGICAAIFSGSWSWMMKLESVKRGTHPAILTAYLATGMFASSWLVLPLISEFNFTPLGFVSGIIFCVGNALMLVAMDFVGVAIAQGCWTCAEFTVAFFWSAVIFKSHMTSKGMAIFGLVVMYIGVACLVWTMEANGKDMKVAVDANEQSIEARSTKMPLLEDREVGGQRSPRYGLQDGTDYSWAKKPSETMDCSCKAETQSRTENEHFSSEPGAKKASFARRLLDKLGLENVTINQLKGAAFAILGGLIMGNVLVPMECLQYYTSSGSKFYGVKYMPSLGIGVMTMTWTALSIRMIYWNTYGYRAPEGNRIKDAPFQNWPNMNVATALPAGLLGGLVWMLSAVSTIYVMVTLSSYVVGIVFRAGSLIVGGLWGIVLFRELVGRGVILFMGSALVLATGIVIMACYSD